MKAHSSLYGEEEVEEQLEEEPSLTFIEPWRCEECNQLMYNVNYYGYPAPGAPVGYQIKPYGKPMRVCSLCVQMYINIHESDYLKKEHNSWMKEQANKNKLKSGHNYLDKRE